MASLIGQGADQLIVVRSSDAGYSDELLTEFANVEWIERNVPSDLPELQWHALSKVESDLIAFLEAPSIAGPGWIAAHLQTHIDHPQVFACGGPVRPPQGASAWENGWHWSDYASYAPGRSGEMTRDLTDANVSYKTQQLRTQQQSLLRQCAWGWRLRESLPSPCYYEPLAWIDYPCPHALGVALRQRYAAGRAHGAAVNYTAARRLVSIVTAPLLPALLAWRGWNAARRAGSGAQYTLALPWTLVFHAYWACGELVGLLWPH